MAEAGVDDVAVDRAEGVAQPQGERVVEIRGQLGAAEQDLVQRGISLPQSHLIVDAGILPAHGKREPGRPRDCVESPQGA